MTLTAYVQPDKPKSRLVLDAFAAGCGARLASTTARRLEGPGPVAFYGVRPGWMHLFDQAKAEGRTWYYLDNSWFDVARERYFRIGVDALQSWSDRPSDGRRLAALGVKVQPWRRGRHIVVCRQSDEYMRTLGGWRDGGQGWQFDVLSALKLQTDRQIVVRAKGGDRPLAADLRDAWLLVTHSSAAAVEALIAGVPVIVTDPRCAAASMGGTFAKAEDPRIPEGREQWAARLADSQWTLDEMRRGDAWRAIRALKEAA